MSPVQRFGWAIVIDDLKLLQSLYDDDSALINTLLGFELAPLAYACSECGNAPMETVKWLYDHGADINAKSSKNASTALHQAVMRDDLDIVKFLCANGADINAIEGSSKYRPLTYAERYDCDGIAEYLRELGAINDYEDE